MGLFSKIAQGLKKTRDNMAQQMDNLFKSFKKVDEELFEELEEILIMADVGMLTSERICGELRERVKKEKVSDSEEVKRLLREIIAGLLEGDQTLHLNSRPSVILVIGVNGVGKTTTIGKLANQLREEGKKVILAAGDTFRAAAGEQLEIWAKRSQTEMVRHAEGADPAAVVFDATAAAKARRADVVMVDTAGRLHNKKHLRDELPKTSRVIKRELPDADQEVLLVLDATTGQNAVNQAREFKNAAGITGIVLTKLDGTAKGGVVISIMEELQVPVKYIGVGEQMDDLQPFDAASFAQALFEGAEADE